MPRPIVEFWQLVPGGRLPCRASPDVQGTLPVAALRYCKPVQEACEWGYSLFLPRDIALRWDGASGLELSYDVDGTGVGAEWIALLPECHHPDFAAYWAEHAPADLHLDVPPFVTMSEDYGLVQVWSGCFARTWENWSLLVRGPVNDSRRSLGYDYLEGIIATDRFGGPIPTNIRLLKAGAEIYIPAHRPFLHVIPIYRPHYNNRWLDRFSVGGFDMPEERWDAYRAWRDYVVDPKRRYQGGYIRQEMRRWAGKE